MYHVSFDWNSRIMNLYEQHIYWKMDYSGIISNRRAKKPSTNPSWTSCSWTTRFVLFSDFFCRRRSARCVVRKNNTRHSEMMPLFWFNQQTFQGNCFRMNQQRLVPSQIQFFFPFLSQRWLKAPSCGLVSGCTRLGGIHVRDTWISRPIYSTCRHKRHFECVVWPGLNQRSRCRGDVKRLDIEKH